MLCTSGVGQRVHASDSVAPPNIVLILADDLGFSDLGCYGGEIETPQLDALAKQGIRFTQCYNTARCWPTRAALLTGYYAQQVRRDAFDGEKGGAQGSRPAWAPLLAVRLKELGYRNYHSGKWHIDGDPRANGFDHSYDVAGVSQSNYFQAQANKEDGQQVPQTDDYYVTTAIADHAVRTLRQHGADHADRPFFHYLCFTAPHFPLQAPTEDIARYAGRYAAGWEVTRTARHARLVREGIVNCALSPLEREIGPPYAFANVLEKLGAGEVNRPLPWNELSPEQQRFQAAKMEVHAAMVDRMDREIGKVCDQLRAMNAWENTLILFLSDNGASAEMMIRGSGHDATAPLGSSRTFACLGPGFSSCANTPWRRHKTWVHEGGIATPLLAHWPRGVKVPGTLQTHPTHVVDVVPTLLELAGAAAAPITAAGPPLAGQSFAPLLRGAEPASREALWWLHEGNKAIRVGDWKLVAARNEPWELYDLATDRSEQHNRAAEFPDRVAELAALWQTRHDSYRNALKAEAANTPPAGKKGKRRPAE